MRISGLLAIVACTPLPHEPAPASAPVVAEVAAPERVPTEWMPLELGCPEGQARCSRVLQVDTITGEVTTLDAQPFFPGPVRTDDSIVRVPIAGGALEVVARARQPGDVVDFDVHGERRVLAVQMYDPDPRRTPPPG